MRIKDISLVIATYNSADILKNSIVENLKINFGAIIIIDGESTDDTKEIVQKYKIQYPNLIQFYQIPKRGLANARNFGTSKVKTLMAMHAGPDNVLPLDTVKQILKDALMYDWVSCQTRRLSSMGYLNKAHNISKKRFAPGVQSVVGTPYLAATSLFKKFPFNEKMLNSDDTEVCQRLELAGKKIFRSQAICLEIGFEGLADIAERWLRWGRGDALFYEQNKNNWNLARKIKSWCRPFIAELVESAFFLSVKEFLFVLPFLIMVCFLRFAGWLRYISVKRKVDF